MLLALIQQQTPLHIIFTCCALRQYEVLKDAAAYSVMLSNSSTNVGHAHSYESIPMLNLSLSVKLTPQHSDDEEVISSPSSTSNDGGMSKYFSA